MHLLVPKPKMCQVRSPPPPPPPLRESQPWMIFVMKQSTVRSGVKERAAEERPALNDKNILAWPKNFSVCKFWSITFCTVRYKNVIRTQPEDKNVQPGPSKRAFFGTRSYCRPTVHPAGTLLVYFGKRPVFQQSFSSRPKLWPELKWSVSYLGVWGHAPQEKFYF